MSFDFNVNDLPVNEEKDFSVIPAGVYEVIIEKAEVKPTKDGTGEYINITHRIVSADYNNRIVFNILNIKNKSAEAERIGRQQLRNLMESIKVERLTNTEMLLNRTVKVHVGIQKSEQYGDKNTVKKYEPSSSIGISTQKSAVASSDKPAWMAR